MPKINEQEKIGKLFEQIDNLITLHQRKFNYILSHKLEIKLFFFKITKNVWEQRKLSELCNIYDGTHQTPDYKDSGIMFLSVENIKDLSSNKYISYEDFKKNFKVYPEKNDILMTRIGDIGTTNIVKENSLKAYYVSLALLKCRSINPYYLNFAIKSDYVQNGLKLRSLLTAIPMKINKDQIGKVDINYPIDPEEQSNIGKLFDNLDNLITLHQRKCTYIFYSWEQRELFDVADYRNGKAHENDIDDDGKYIVINSKFVSTEGKIKKYSNKQNEPLFQNEIAFVLSDVPNGRAIAKTFLVDKSSKYTLNQRIAGITPHSNINPKFLSITMNRNKYFLQFDDGVKQTNLSLNDMKKFEEFYPNKQEQDKIGDLFINLDNLITLHQHKELKRRNDNNDNLRW